MATRTSSSGRPQEDIAVVGVACLFPGAPNAAVYWRNILSKVDAITDPPHEAWEPSLYYDIGSHENDRVYCRKGGYLGPLAYIDPFELGIVPRAVEGGEPDQWLALRVAREALQDAGMSDASAYRERAALILGKGTYANRGTLSVVQHGLLVDCVLGLLSDLHPALTDADLALLRRDLKRRLPRFDSETAPALIPNVTVGRIANRLDIMGPSYTIDAACASSLVAIDIAAKGLRECEYDLALVGGLQAATPVQVLSLFCQLRALSPSEAIRPFDASADGTLLSEGIGMAVLKRRSQAERDGDRIYAVIKGTGVASDGRAVGVLAPRVEGEELALRKAYDAGGIEPATVGLIEAHGTGTPVGDATEIEALVRVFGERDRAPHCALGSVKSMIGHTMPAAGMAGFIKAVLALYHKVLPPTLHVTEPNPKLGLKRTPFYLNTETRPWIHGGAHPRRAGVNSFGFGGINAHVVVEEAPAADAGATLDTDWDSELCLFTAADRAGVVALGRDVLGALTRDPRLALVDVAFTLNISARTDARSGVTLAIVAHSTTDLTHKLERALTRMADPHTRQIKEASGIYYFGEPLGRAGKVAFVFPGEGAQYLNMLADLCRHFPIVRACFDEMDRVLFDHPRGYRLSEVIFPPPAFTDADRVAAEKRLGQMDLAVESVTTANHAITHLLAQLGIVPDVVLGHSSGEFSAMRAAGMFDEDEKGFDARIVSLNDDHRRHADSGALPSGARLIAVGAARERVEAICAAAGVPALVAMDNCPHQVVIAADATHASPIEACLRSEGVLYEVLSLDRPYHTPFFEPFAGTLKRALGEWIVHPPTVPVYSCTSVSPYPTDVREARVLAYEHWIRPVEFRQTIRRMWDDGVRMFVEAGPRGNLTAFIEDVLGGLPMAAVAANVTRRSDVKQLHHLLGQLAAHGVPMSLELLYERRRPSSLDWSIAGSATSGARALGRVKLPTGAPDLRLSPEMIDLVRRRAIEPPSHASHEPALPHRPDTDTSEVIAREPVPLRDAVHDDASTSGSVGVLPTTTPSRAGAPLAMSAFFQTMDRFLTLQRSLMDGALLSRRSIAPQSTSATSLVEFVEAPRETPAQFLSARCRLDLEQHPFLRDHTIGRDVSDIDPGLTGLPIVPFTVLMELMAQTARGLAPTQLVIGMREVRVHRWLALDKGPITLDLTAERREGTAVAVRMVEEDAQELGVVAEATIILGDRYPVPPQAQSLSLVAERAYMWPPDRLYAEAMFHGPAFRGVSSMDRVGEDGSQATLTVAPRQGLLTPSQIEGLATDFVLLDQPGQVVGFWAHQQLERAFVVLPSRLGALHLYGPLQPEGARLTCQARTALLGDRQVRSDLDVLEAQGRLWARFEEWDDHRFEAPRDVFRALLEPATASLSRQWQVPANSNGTAATAFRIGSEAFPPGWLNAHGGLWLRAVASVVLGRRERERWHGMNATPQRRIEWLLGRIAAKDVVRQFVRQRAGVTLRPADVEIVPDGLGRPTAQGVWTSQVPCIPHISIAHVSGVAMAFLGSGEDVLGVGIDLERQGRMKPGMEEAMFRPHEREFLHDLLGEEREAWLLRLWCAKEASAKAIGGAASPVSDAVAIEDVDRERGTVIVRYRPPQAESVALPVVTARDGEWIVATCINHSTRPLPEVLTT